MKKCFIFNNIYYYIFFSATANRGQLQVLKIKTSTYKGRAFGHVGPSTWSALPDNLKCSSLTLLSAGISNISNTAHSNSSQSVFGSIKVNMLQRLLTDRNFTKHSNCGTCETIMNATNIPGIKVTLSWPSTSLVSSRRSSTSTLNNCSIVSHSSSLTYTSLQLKCIPIQKVLLDCDQSSVLHPCTIFSCILLSVKALPGTEVGRRSVVNRSVSPQYYTYLIHYSSLH